MKDLTLFLNLDKLSPISTP